MMKTWLLTCTALAMTGPVVANSVADVVADRFVPAPTGAVQIEGMLGQKLDQCMANRVMAQSLERILEPFQTRREGQEQGFRCEFWGKWFTSAALGYAYEPTPEHRALIDRAVQGLLDTQSPDGYIGTYKTEYQLGYWDVWGRKYVLLGLLAYYDVTGDTHALEAAKQETDYLMTQVGPDKANIAGIGYPGWKGLPPSSVLEPVALLYRRTGEKRYLDFAEYIVGQWGKPSDLAPEGLHLVDDAIAGKDAADIGAPKAYEMMSCYEGLCELYRATGNDRYFKAAQSLAENIRKTERMIVGSGSNHELWDHGARYQTNILEQPLETCVTVTWMKFCNQLLRLTGDSQWADEMEVALYNALLGAMTPEGRWWSYYCPLEGERVASHYQYPDVGLSCCVANGPRGLLLTPRWAVMTSEDGPIVNLYAPGTANVPLPDGTACTLRQETDYPVGDEVTLTVSPAEQRRFTLRLRIPAWSKQTELRVNGNPVACRAGSYAAIDREWAPGDEVTLKLDMRGRAVPAPSGAPQFAVMRGPIVLALDNRLAQPDDTAVRLVRDAEGYVDLKPVADKPDDVWMAFEAPFEVHPIHVKYEPKSLVMCDFQSAGNRWSADNLYRVWLPQPLFLSDMYTPDTWKLMYPGDESRPEIPVQQ